MPSKQGVNVAFIGMAPTGQIACAEYLSSKLGFKRMDLDEGLIHFLRTTYGYHSRLKMKRPQIIEFYDTIYKLDNNIWIQHFVRRFMKTENDVVVANVRYLNELEILRNLGFIIVRVTQGKNRPYVGHHVKTADKNTVALSIMYDKNFASNYDVEYSIDFTTHGALPQLLRPVLVNGGYIFDN